MEYLMQATLPPFQPSHGKCNHVTKKTAVVEDGLVWDFQPFTTLVSVKPQH